MIFYCWKEVKTGEKASWNLRQFHAHLINQKKPCLCTYATTLHCTPTSSSILDNEVDFFRALSSRYFTNLVKLSPKNTGFLSLPARELTYVLCLPVIGRKKARISKYLASACPSAQCSSELNAFQLFLWQSFLSFYSSAPKSWNLRDSSTVYDSWVLKGRRSDYGGSDAYSSFFFLRGLMIYLEDHHIRSRKEHNNFDTIFHYYPFSWTIIEQKIIF